MTGSIGTMQGEMPATIPATKPTIQSSVTSSILLHQRSQRGSSADRQSNGHGVRLPSA
jgi:hypothetical protein